MQRPDGLGQVPAQKLRRRPDIFILQQVDQVTQFAVIAAIGNRPHISRPRAAAHATEAFAFRNGGEMEEPFAADKAKLAIDGVHCTDALLAYRQP